jgi:23S rRNA-intervening sequence protein
MSDERVDGISAVARAGNSGLLQIDVGKLRHCIEDCSDGYPGCSCVHMASNSRANNLEDRLVQFAVDVVTLVGQLPQTPQAKHIANQILRAGTAAAPNYGEARAAESRADFVHKLKICLKELNETSI